MDKSLWYDTLAGMPIPTECNQLIPAHPISIASHETCKRLVAICYRLLKSYQGISNIIQHSIPCLSQLVSENYIIKAPCLYGDSHCSYLNYIWHTSHNHFHQKFMHNKRIGQNCPETLFVILREISPISYFDIDIDGLFVTFGATFFNTDKNTRCSKVPLIVTVLMLRY